MPEYFFVAKKDGQKRGATGLSTFYARKVFPALMFSRETSEKETKTSLGIHEADDSTMADD